MLNKIRVIGLVIAIIMSIVMSGCNNDNSFFNDFKEGFQDAQE